MGFSKEEIEESNKIEDALPVVLAKCEHGGIICEDEELAANLLRQRGLILHNPLHEIKHNDGSISIVRYAQATPKGLRLLKEYRDQGVLPQPPKTTLYLVPVIRKILGF